MKLRAISERKLKQKDRDKIPGKDFAGPDRSYPIPDRSHAANALSRSSGKGVAGKVKKKVCSKYPDMNSCKESMERYIELARAGKRLYSENADWSAELVSEPVIVTQEQADGSKKRFQVMKHRVDMTDGKRRMSFKVSKGSGGFPVFTDTRETQTGAAQTTNRGPLPGEQYAKPGVERKLTATAWADQVERLIGPAQVGQIFMSLIKSGFKAG